LGWLIFGGQGQKGMFLERGRVVGISRGVGFGGAIFFSG